MKEHVITIQIRLDQKDLDYIAQIPADEIDPSVPETEYLHKLFKGVMVGGVEDYTNDPDYEAFVDFALSVQEIWQRLSPLERLGAVQDG